MPAPDFIFIPTPGDHYSPATGSAVMTVIHQFAIRHAARGGRSQIIVNRGTRHDHAVGQCIEVTGLPYPPKWKRAVDAGLSHLGFGRPMSAGIYRPHLSAIPEDFQGPVFLCNAPSAMPLARRMRPRAALCLWAHNELFRTYGDSEVSAVVSASDRLLCCSRYIAEVEKRRAPASLADRVRVVHNGVDPDQFHPPAAPPQNSPPVILFVGRIQPQKGPDLLIRAAAKLAAEGLAFTLKIVGSQNFCATDPLTPFEKQLRELAQPLGDRVQFHPFTGRAAIVAVYQSADINVVPSNWDEPFGLTVLEAMACGLPTVVSRRGGIPEAAGDAALYFDPPNTNQLADQLRSLLKNPAARSALGQKARARALEMTWEHSYRRLLAALQ